MLPQYYQQYAAIEDDLWWHRARCFLLDQCLIKARVPEGGRILDVGCGTGATTAHLCKHGHVVGIDAVADAVAIAAGKAPQARIVQGDVNQLPLQLSAESFDLVTLLHVLYHDWIRDEIKVLRDLHSLLRPGGVLLLTEPAFPILRRRQDRFSMGKRRYRVAGLRQRLAEAQFHDVVICCYFNASCFLPSLASALFARVHGNRGMHDDKPLHEVSVPPKWINEAAFRVMRIEARWIRWTGFLPFGVSIVCAARKSGP